jgi:eukaryotic-like serine/threonine-protein kinase
MHPEPATLPEPSRSRDPSRCPSDDELLAFLPGELSGPAAASIATHLATCQLCQSRITTLKQRLSDRLPADGNAKAAAPVSAHPVSDSPTTLLQPIRPQTPRRLGEYELLEPIGRGGMGVVYRARHVRLQRIVAVKVLPHLQLSDDSAIVRMQRESAAAGRVRHPNIVYATDAGEAGGVHYLVMEHVEGTDLSKLVAALGPLPVAEACEIIRQAALGLAHISACGLVHRDLKPSNVMLSNDGTVKILDLGLARLHPQAVENPFDDAEPTQAGYLLGTADYIAPEQIDSPHDADVRSDLYSLGCTFFKLLHGTAPFSSPEQNSVSKKVEAHRRLPAPSIRSVRPDVSAEVEQVLAQLLAKKPADRWQDPQALADALAPLAGEADLVALIRQLREEGEVDEWPHDPQRLPVSTNATTQPLLHTPTPQLAPHHGRGTPRNLAALVLVAIAFLAGVAAVYLTAGGFQAPTALTPARLPTSKSVVYDVARLPTEVQWIGHLRSPPPFYNKDRQMLEVRPDSFQLLELGRYDGQPGTFTATISQAKWHGDAGLFFGCRSEPHGGGRLLTTFQLFLLEHFPAQGTGAGAVQELFQIRRQRAFIKVNPYDFSQDPATIMSPPENFPPPAGSQITIEIAFSRTGCERVRVNGTALDDLTTATVNAKYRAEDYLGSFGLYCTAAEVDAVGGDRLGPTWFGNVVFAPAE